MAKRVDNGVSSAETRALKIGDVIKGMNKTYKGAQLLVHARDDKRLIVPRVSTGLYALDVATNGGMPLHRMSLVYGKEKGGKSTLLLRSLANMQRLCGNCSRPARFELGVMKLPDLKTGEIKDVETQVITSCECGNPRDVLALWVDAEGVWLPEWSASMGVWPEKVLLFRPGHGEQGYDVITSFASQGVLDLVVIDSIAAMTPADELASGMGEQSVGLAARMNNKFVRKIISLMNKGFQEDNLLTVWAINQYRAKIGGAFAGPKNEVTGGRGQKYATSLDIEMSPGKIVIDDQGEPLYGEFYWAVKKNKIGVDGGKGTFKQWMADTDLFRVGDLQEHDLVIQKACDMGLVEHPNATMYHFDGEKFRGINSLVRYLGENPVRYAELKEQMLRQKLHFGES